MALRHWKQHFSADADMIFTKRMKLGCCGVAEVNPGDPVTDEMKAALGRNRLRIWWNAKFLELANFDGDEGRVLSRDELAHREQLHQRIADAKAQDDLENGSCLDGPLEDSASCPDEDHDGPSDPAPEQRSEESPF